MRVALYRAFLFVCSLFRGFTPTAIDFRPENRGCQPTTTGLRVSTISHFPEKNKCLRLILAPMRWSSAFHCSARERDTTSGGTTSTSSLSRAHSMRTMRYSFHPHYSSRGAGRRVPTRGGPLIVANSTKGSNLRKLDNLGNEIIPPERHDVHALAHVLRFPNDLRCDLG